MDPTPILRRAAYGTLLASTLAVPLVAQQEPPDSADPTQGKRVATPAGPTGRQQAQCGWSLRGVAGPAFTGVRVAEALPVAAFSLNGQQWTPRPDSLDLVRNSRIAWRPALATGVVAEYGFVEGLQVGIGAELVTTTSGAGSTSIWPALTFHIGNADQNVFVGYVFTQSDAIRFPNGRDVFRVPVGTSSDGFRLASSQRFGALLIGLTVGGLRFSGRPANQEAATAPAGQAAK